eukprot:scaffold353140_cov18-Prasinocladus_malaysianus.AAC.2
MKDGDKITPVPYACYTACSGEDYWQAAAGDVIQSLGLKGATVRKGLTPDPRPPARTARQPDFPFACTWKCLSKSLGTPGIVATKGHPRYKSEKISRIN